MRPKVLLLILSLSTGCLYGQERSEPLMALEKIYLQHIPVIQDIAMGGYFEDPPLNIKGHSRFLTTTFEPGEVVINGLNYKNVSLSYDIYSDELITFHPVFSRKISLQPGKVSSFILADGSHFIYKTEIPDFASHNNGYYQVLWDQDIQIFAKHRKVVKNNPDRDEFPYRFISKTNYFIEIDQQISQVKNGNHAIGLLGIEKREIRKQLKENNMNYRRDPISYLKFIGRFHSLNK